MSNVADMFYLYLYFNLFAFVYISSYLLLRKFDLKFEGVCVRTYHKYLILAGIM